MPHSLVDNNASFSASVVVPNAGETVKAADVEVACQSLANRTAHIYSGNTVFTGSKNFQGTTTIDNTSFKCANGGRFAGDIPLSGESNNVARLLGARVLASGTPYTADHRQGHLFVIAPGHGSAVTVKLMDANVGGGVNPGLGTRIRVIKIATPGGTAPSAFGVTIYRGNGVTALAVFAISQACEAEFEFMDLSSHDTSSPGPAWYLVDWTSQVTPQV